MASEGHRPDDINDPEERPINGVLTNARLRHKPEGGLPGTLRVGEMKLGRWGWVGGRLYVDDDEVRFAGVELTGISTESLDEVAAIRYAVAVPAAAIASVERRRGVVGVPYVALTTTDGAELQLRSGIAGNKSDLVIETIEHLVQAG